MSLDAQRRELEALGFRIVEQGEDAIVVIQRVLAPGQGSKAWPVSVAGILLTLFFFGALALNLARVFGR